MARWTYNISVGIGCSGLIFIFSGPVCLRSLKTSLTMFTQIPKLISGVLLVGRACKQIRLQSSESRGCRFAWVSECLASREAHD